MPGDLPPGAANWARANDFTARPGSYLIVPNREGKRRAVLFAEDDEMPLAAGTLGRNLPGGDYILETGFRDADLSALAFMLGTYRHSLRSSKGTEKKTVLRHGPRETTAKLNAILGGVATAQDLINTPANMLGPAELAQYAVDLFAAHGGTSRIFGAGELEAEGFPLVHTVGAGSDRPPCVAECFWGDTEAPRVALVGKGIVFDTGGLGIKPSNAMELMKKDMGGAANILGLARMVMTTGLAVHLHVILPCAENAVSGRAFRPGDVLRSAGGQTVEIGHTDAEGRLVLADALDRADRHMPDLLIDLATLTGAARIALGPDLPALFTPSDRLAARLQHFGHAVDDPSWRLPLWTPYRRYLATDNADFNNVNVTGRSFAGAITAALFLSSFVKHSKNWIHGDIYGWTPAARPARPAGGAAQLIRALFAMIEERYAS